MTGRRFIAPTYTVAIRAARRGVRRTVPRGTRPDEGSRRRQRIRPSTPGTGRPGSAYLADPARQFLRLGLRRLLVDELHHRAPRTRRVPPPHEVRLPGVPPDDQQAVNRGKDIIERAHVLIRAFELVLLPFPRSGSRGPARTERRLGPRPACLRATGTRGEPRTPRPCRSPPPELPRARPWRLDRPGYLVRPVHRSMELDE